MSQERQRIITPLWGVPIVTQPSPQNGEHMLDESEGRMPNGTRKLVWWMMASFAAIAAALVSLIYSSGQHDLVRLREADINRGERLITLETKADETYRRLGSVETTVVAINDKLNDMLREIRLIRYAKYSR